MKRSVILWSGASLQLWLGLGLGLELGLGTPRQTWGEGQMEVPLSTPLKRQLSWPLCGASQWCPCGAEVKPVFSKH